MNTLQFPSHWSRIRKLLWLKILSGASAVWDTITGNPVSFSAKAAPLRQLKVAFSPKQDLHGYDSPWPAGGGKNKFSGAWPPDVTDLYAGWNTGATVNCTLKLFDKGNGADISGVYFGVGVNGSNTPVIWAIQNGTIAQNPIRTVADYRDVLYPYVTMYPKTEETLAKVLNRFDVMATLDGVDYPVFYPYENECPISGWTGVNVWQRGSNLWDEEWEVGSIKPDDGQNSPTTVQIRSKGYIACLPSTQYYLQTSLTSNDVRIAYYDADKNYISMTVWLFNGVFTTVPNAYFMRFFTASAYGTTYKNDISINYPATDTSYHAYNPLSRSISINIGSTVYSGELDVVTGALTVDMAEEDMGSLSWTLASSYGAHTFQASISGKAFGESNLLSDIYDVDAVAISSIKNGGMRGHASNTNVYVRNDDYSDAQTFTTAMNGHQLVYELAQPIPIQLTPQEVQSLLGVNNMWSDANGDLTVTYRSN